jgi:hypothetical protein
MTERNALAGLWPPKQSARRSIGNPLSDLSIGPAQYEGGRRRYFSVQTITSSSPFRSRSCLRALIASHLWDMNFDSDSDIVCGVVRRLRQKVDDRRDAVIEKFTRGACWKLVRRSVS